MIIENYHDPTETVFNLLGKMIAKKGVNNPQIDLELCHQLNIKLYSEILFEEFLVLLTAFICRKVPNSLAC